jgi:cytochrome c peroxidase
MAWGCKNDLPEPSSGPYSLEVPEGFPLPFIPEDNALTYERIALGKKLFYDPILSLDSSRSCASCHLPALAFSDSVAFSLGIENRLGTRNSPTLANVAYQKALLREGGIPTLEMQVLVPIQEHNEFDFNILVAGERMLADPEYVEMSMASYDREPDPYVITRAISAFERTMISGESPFDLFYFQGKNSALSASQKRGWELFQSDRLNCSKCHEGFLFTSQGFANNGLYDDYPDPGRLRLTGEESDRAVFKIPTLRNIALTAPYMHDGSLPNLQSVLAHYETGGRPHVNKSVLVKPFSLTEQERADLLEFLQSLTDEAFLNNPAYAAP